MNTICLSRPLRLAGLLLVAGIRARAGSPTADVMVYVTGYGGAPPGPVEYKARLAVTGIYARIGVRLAWRDGAPVNPAPSAGPLLIQVRFVDRSPGKISPNALAFALPFADDLVVINVLYYRIQIAASRWVSEESILTGVLAHEIGHVLQCSDHHATTGIMKTGWTPRDQEAMRTKLPEFTPDDVDLIAKGLAARKARATEIAAAVIQP